MLPGYALAGYRGAVATMSVLAALIVLVMFRLAADIAGSGPASLAWIAVAPIIALAAGRLVVTLLQRRSTSASFWAPVIVVLLFVLGESVLGGATVRLPADLEGHSRGPRRRACRSCREARNRPAFGRTARSPPVRSPMILPRPVTQPS